MRPELVIFDCDGVLVDSERLANLHVARALTEAGLPTTYEESCATYIGRSMKQVIAEAERRLGRALPEDWLSTLQDDLNQAFRRELQPVRGVASVVRALVAAGVPTCVASSGTVEKMTLTLGVTGLIGHFEGRLFSTSMVANGKPAPDIFLHAARVMGYAPDACVVIEDSLAGVTGAHRAGMRVLAYAADGAPDALARAGGHVFHDMAELPALLGLPAA